MTLSTLAANAQVKIRSIGTHDGRQRLNQFGIADGPHPVTPVMTLSGERFLVNVAGGQVFLSHPQWSLIGTGDTMAAARENLLEEARQLAAVMIADDPATLSDEANRLRTYVLGVR